MNILGGILKNKPEGQTVFTTVDVKQMCEVKDSASLHSMLYYAVRKGFLYRIKKGVYALDENYSKEELANKLRRPSYISLYTVLQSSGVVFQPYTSIFAVSKRSETLLVEGQKYIYRSVKDDILLNTVGLKEEKGVYVATPERALFDIHYFLGTSYASEINYKIIYERTGKNPKEFYKMLYTFLSNIPSDSVLDGLGEILSEEQKKWAKEKLLEELKGLVLRQMEFVE